jgi:hypothetical protein
VRGFAGDRGRAPAAGFLRARAIRDNAGDAGRVRSWQIKKHCRSSTSCRYTMTRFIPDGPTQTASLLPEADGWHVTYPTIAFHCFCPGTGERTIYRTRTSYVLRFGASARPVLAHEAFSYWSRECPYALQLTEWSAVRANV